MASFIISVVSTLAVTLLSFVLVLLLRAKIAVWLKSPELETFLWFLPLTVFLSGIGQAINYYASRSGRFGAMAWASFGSISGSTFLTILLGLVLGASAIYMFIGQIIGMILNALILFVFIFREFLLEARTANLSFMYIWEITKLHRKFPIYDIWSGLFNSVSVQLPPIILGVYFSTTVVGYYSLGQRFVGLPMSLLGSSIAQVFFPSAAKEYNETGRLTNIINITFKRLVQIGVFPFMVLGFFGGPLFGLFFGKNWLEAGVYTQILSSWMFFVFITSPLSTSFAILNRQGTGLAFNIGLIFSRLSSLLIGSQTGQPRVALTAFMGVGVVGWILISSWILYFNNVSIRQGLREIAKYILLSLGLLFPALFVYQIWHNLYIMTIMLASAVMFYFFVLYKFEKSIHSYINKILNQISGVILCRKGKTLS